MPATCAFSKEVGSFDYASFLTLRSLAGSMRGAPARNRPAHDNDITRRPNTPGSQVAAYLPRKGPPPVSRYRSRYSYYERRPSRWPWFFAFLIVIAAGVTGLLLFRPDS